MKVLKRLFIGVIILFLLVGASIFVLITFYKKEIAVILTDNLRTDYGLHLEVEDVDVSLFSNWPHASVKLKNVVIANDADHQKVMPLLKAGSLALSLNLENVLKKKFVVNNISLKDAEVFLIKETDGSRNFEFRKPKPVPGRTAPAIDFDVQKISLERVKFGFRNKERGQDIGIDLMDVDVKLKIYADGVKAELKGKTLVDQLLFNPKNGAFLSHTRAILDVQMHFLNKEKTLCIYPGSSAEIDGHNYQVLSLINLGEKRTLDLKISSEKIKFERVVSLLNPKIRKTLSNFEVLRPLDASILIHVNLGQKEEPVLLAEVIGKDCDLQIGKSKIPYSGLYFKGRIISLDSSRQRGDMEHARVEFTQVKGRVYDFPFTANVLVQNLQTPSITINASLLVEAKKIKTRVSSDFILKGSALATIKYSGPTNKLNSQEFLKEPMKLQAYLLFNDFSYKEIDRPYVYAVSGKASLANESLRFDNLKLKSSIADATLKGQANGFVSYALGYTKGFSASLSANTPFLDLNPVLANNAEKKEEEKMDSKAVAANTKKISDSHFEFKVNLHADKFLVRKVEASNATLDLYYKDNSLLINNLNVNTCDGKIKAKASIKDFNQISSTITVEQVNVTKLFSAFENFGQSAIVSENLKGNISLDAQFKTELNKDMQIKNETMAGEVKLRLKEGHLINFEPVQNLSNFLFKNRDFNDVSFTDLTETFKIRGYEMKIEELEIGSNVLNLYVVNGLYNFKGNSSINILVPWNNLKKRGKDYVPKNSGQSAADARGLKLNFSGPSKNMKISMGHKEQEKRFW
ncbi:MAG: hypothetical protein JNL60_03135 [Bacteroidia bacterium]|nr:hypothetical protein [Bacteroidia bacterium]